MPSHIIQQIRRGVGPTSSAGAATTITYATTTAAITNPERGFYHQIGGEAALSFSQLQGYRTSAGHTLVLFIFYMRGKQAASLSAGQVTLLGTQLNTVRSAGIKAIVRFAYDDASGADASPSWVTTHLNQLAANISANSDVIACIQAGFVGQWGEWGTTTVYGDSYNMTAQNRADRKSVVDAILATLPSDRMVQLRMPLFKTSIYSATAALTVGAAHTGLTLARLGHHNDCFLSNASDFGTYINTPVEYPYLSAETQYVVAGGETCSYLPPRSNCPTALNELQQFHWSYLHRDYNTTVLDNWISQSCFSSVNINLGYRFVLTKAVFPLSATHGNSFPFNITLNNEGYAACFNPRNVELVLRNTVSSAVHRIAISAADPRFWLGGTTISLSATVTIPASASVGSYTLLLNLPDPKTLLNTRPEYSIQVANSGTWETTTGYNNLNHTIVVT